MFTFRRKRSLGVWLKDHLIPHEGNGHVPELFRHKVLFSFSILLVVAKGTALLLSLALPEAHLYSSALTSQNVIALTNQVRTSFGIAQVEMDERLMAAANAKARHMAKEEYFAHTSPEGLTPWYWIRAYGYDYQVAGENLAVHFQSAESVTEGWMASPTHRANMVNERYTNIGVGIAEGEYQGYETLFVVQMFGLPIEPVAAEPMVTDAPEEDAASPVVQGEAEEITERDSEEPDSVQVVLQAESQEEESSGIALEAEKESSGTELALAAANASEEPQADSEEQEESMADDSSVSEQEEGENGLALDRDSVVVTPEEHAYHVRLRLSGASSASVHLGTASAELTYKEEEGEWQGTLSYNEAMLDDQGHEIFLIALNDKGEKLVEPLMWVAPNADVSTFFGLARSGNASGLPSWLQKNTVTDAVNVFYLMSIIVIAAVLLMMVLIKAEQQKHTVLAHVLIVLLLAMILALL